MQITLTNCRYAPRWDTLQTMLREVTNNYDGKIVRIARVDNSCDYQNRGTYELDFRHDDVILPITLKVM